MVEKNKVNEYVIGVLEENVNACNVYEKWGGELSSYTQFFSKLNIDYNEVFYTYETSKKSSFIKYNIIWILLIILNLIWFYEKFSGGK